MQEAALVLGLIVFVPCLLFVFHQAPIDIAAARRGAP
jgi:hypothetical protein